ncbi:hypothetical protein BB558_005324 [Smittium angustum]|uniref:Uncharacterized protein n=1 Tax=Smittium angustum TaxID=133377 RepID=A0A2U1J0T4_SMIAN|nr:hypothetical protein BB558_005324 [Smittium angustum]
MNRILRISQIHLNPPQNPLAYTADFRLSNFLLSEALDISSQIGPITWISIDSTNSLLLISSSNGSIAYYNLQNTFSTSEPASLKPVYKIKSAHGGFISGVEWYPIDSGMFTTCSHDNSIKVWDTQTAENVFDFDMGFRVSSHSMASNGSHNLIAAVGFGDQVRICDLQSGINVQSITDNDTMGISVKWSNKYEYILATGGLNGSVKIYDIRKLNTFLFKLVEDINSTNNTENAHNGLITSLYFSESDNKIITSGSDKKLKAWDSITGEIFSVKDMNMNQTVKNSEIKMSPYATRISGSIMEKDYKINSQLLFVPIYKSNKLFITDFDPVHGFKKTDEILQHGQIGVLTGAAYRPGHFELYTSGTDHNILLYKPKSEERVTEAQKKVWQDSWSENSENENI